MKHASPRTLVILALAMPLLGSANARGQSFTRLDQMNAQGLSGDGSRVVGQRLDGPVGTYWNANDGYTDFGSEPGFGPFVAPNAISESGRYIAGNTLQTGRPQRGLFRYDTVTRTVQYFGALAGLPITTANGISADGNVIVGYGYNNSTFQAAAFYWTPSSGLRFIPGLSAPSEAKGVSADGSKIVGNSNAGHGGPTAFVWSETTGPTFLDGLETSSFTSGEAITADGSFIAGWSTFFDGSFDRFAATIWEADGALRQIPMLSGYNQAKAFDISDDGSVVIGVAYDSRYSLSFVWTEATGTIPMRDYLESFGVVLPSDLLLNGQFQMSGDGRTFLFVDGPSFVITIPAPTTGVIPVLIAFAVRRSRVR